MVGPDRVVLSATRCCIPEPIAVTVVGTLRAPAVSIAPERPEAAVRPDR
jgi:hypothetical protein